MTSVLYNIFKEIKILPDCRVCPIQDVDTCFVKLNVTVKKKKKLLGTSLKKIVNICEINIICCCKIFIQLLNNEIRRRLKLYLNVFIQ